MEIYFDEEIRIDAKKDEKENSEDRGTTTLLIPLEIIRESEDPVLIRKIKVREIFLYKPKRQTYKPKKFYLKRKKFIIYFNDDINDKFSYDPIKGIVTGNIIIQNCCKLVLKISLDCYINEERIDFQQYDEGVESIVNFEGNEIIELIERENKIESNRQNKAIKSLENLEEEISVQDKNIGKSLKVNSEYKKLKIKFVFEFNKIEKIISLKGFFDKCSVKTLLMAQGNCSFHDKRLYFFNLILIAIIFSLYILFHFAALKNNGDIISVKDHLLDDLFSLIIGFYIANLFIYLPNNFDYKMYDKYIVNPELKLDSSGFRKLNNITILILNLFCLFFVLFYIKDHYGPCELKFLNCIKYYFNEFKNDIFS